jgi:hypothetical protein
MATSEEIVSLSCSLVKEIHRYDAKKKQGKDQMKRILPVLLY